MLRIVVCISGSISNSFLSGYYGSAFSLAIWQFSVVNIIKGCYNVSNGKLTQLPVVDKPLPEPLWGTYRIIFLLGRSSVLQ